MFVRFCGEREDSDTDMHLRVSLYFRLETGRRQLAKHKYKGERLDAPTGDKGSPKQYIYKKEIRDVKKQLGRQQ